MDYSNSNYQSSSTEDENKPSVLGDMWDGLKNSISSIKNSVTGMFDSSSSQENPNPPSGGKGRKHKKSMKGGKSKKHMSSKTHKGKGKKRTAGRK